jgi:hypothetical protein
MNRDSTLNQIWGGLVMAAVSVALIAITGAGPGGAYAIVFGCLVVGLAYWVWPDVREHFSEPPARRRRHRRSR